MDMVSEQNAFLLDLAKLINFVDLSNDGMLITGGELWRTLEQQKIYFDTGRSKTMNSKHLKRLAIDLNFIKGGAVVNDIVSLQKYGDYWEGLSPENKWGGSWGWDLGHFERSID
jgi:hypothetical protein